MSGATVQRGVGGQREEIQSDSTWGPRREAAHEDHEGDRQAIARLRAEGVLHAEHAMHLREALRSSRTIGAAIGIVMVDRNVGEDDAFAVLSRSSQDANRKLSAIAQEVVEQRTSRHLPRRSA